MRIDFPISRITLFLFCCVAGFLLSLAAYFFVGQFHLPMWMLIVISPGNVLSSLAPMTQHPAGFYIDIFPNLDIALLANFALYFNVLWFGFLSQIRPVGRPKTDGLAKLLNSR